MPSGRYSQAAHFEPCEGNWRSSRLGIGAVRQGREERSGLSSAAIIGAKRASIQPEQNVTGGDWGAKSAG